MEIAASGLRQTAADRQLALSLAEGNAFGGNRYSGKAAAGKSDECNFTENTDANLSTPGVPASSLSGASGGGTSGAAGVLHAMGMDDEFAGAKGNDGAAG